MKRPKYVNHEDEFFKVLKARIENHLTLHRTSNIKVLLKTILLLAAIALSYISLLHAHTVWHAIAGNICLGLAIALAFLNIVHDAAHNCLFTIPWANKLLLHILDLAGANSFLWKIRHVQLHHNYPNVPEWDVDIKQTGLVILYNDSSRSRLHRIQHLYMVVLYFLYTLNWICYRDFKDMFGNYLPQKFGIIIPLKEKVKFIGWKIFYLITVIYLPIHISGLAWTTVLIGFMVLHITLSAVAITALLSAHVDEHAQFPAPDASGKMPRSWAAHQLYTTSDFATNNAIVNFLYGGFNHHVAHHLFPHVNHTHYAAITPIVRQVAHEFHLPYKHMNMLEAMLSHFRLLKKVGNQPPH